VSSFYTDALSKPSVAEALANKKKTAKSSYVRPSCCFEYRTSSDLRAILHISGDLYHQGPSEASIHFFQNDITFKQIIILIFSIVITSNFVRSVLF